MFEHSRFWTFARRSIALSGLALLLAVTLSGIMPAPASAQVAGGGVTDPANDPGVTATDDEDIDEWQNDPLNTPAPATVGGIVDQVISYFLRSLGLEVVGSGTSGQSIR